MQKRALIGLGAALMFATMGCSNPPPGGWVWHPGDPTPARPSDIVGYWAMPPVLASPEKPGDPPRVADISGWITFSGDGTYQSSLTLNGHTTEESGTWRMRQQFFNHIYLRPNGRDHEGQFLLDIRPDSEELIYFSLEEPPYAPFSLSYNRCMVPGRTVWTSMTPKEIRSSPW